MNLGKPFLNLFSNFKRSKRVLQFRNSLELVIRNSIIWQERQIGRSTNSTSLKSTRNLKILIASNIGANLNTISFDTILGLALKDRGHHVDIALCGGTFAACMYAEHQKYKNIEVFEKRGMQDFCQTCTRLGQKSIKQADLNLVWIKSLETSIELEPNESEIADSGAHRFLGVGQKALLDEHPLVISRFRRAEIEYRNAYLELLTKEGYDIVISHHGIYVPQGVAIDVARSLGKRVITWSQAYRKGTFILSWDDTYHKTLLNESLPSDELDEAKVRVISEYLDSRDAGENDWIRFGTATRQNSTVPINTSVTTFALFTNVAWDAQLHYSSQIFKNMHDWIFQTIGWFERNPQYNLIIRIHPAELTGAIPSNDPVALSIDRKFPSLPRNVQIIKPEDRVSSYELMDVADFGLIYGTKAGIELATKGKPVVAAGESWIRNKGIAIEPSSSGDYFSILKALAKGEMSGPPSFQSRALRLAYYYFFERMIPVSSIQPLNIYPYMRPRKRDDWQETDFGLRAIVDSIESGSPFLVNPQFPYS